MEIKAKAKFIRTSPRKIRLVVDLIRGLNVKEAEAQLNFSKKKASETVLKLLRSVVANAENNFELKKDNLFVKSITVDEGPTLRRWRPRAHGRAATIRKRSSHIKIELAEKNLTVNDKTKKVVQTEDKKSDKVLKSEKTEKNK